MSQGTTNHLLLLIEAEPRRCRDIIRELGQMASVRTETITADSGDAALAQIDQRGDIDLILLDLGLGAGTEDGMELLRKIRSASRVPVVVYATEPSTAALEVEAKELGAYGFLDEGAFEEKGYIASYIEGLLEAAAFTRRTYLLVEDNPETRHEIARVLREESSGPVEVIAVDSGEAALARFGLRKDVDLVLLDLDLGPGRMRGMEVLQRIRRTSRVAVVIYTVDTDPDREVEAWELGADGFLDKDKFADSKSSVRKFLEATLERRRRGEVRECYSFDGWVLDADRRRLVNPGGAEVELRDSELDLLLLFVRRPGEVLTLEELIGELEFETAKDPPTALAQRLSRLRKKTTGDSGAAFIRNIYGQGYKFTAAVNQELRP